MLLHIHTHKRIHLIYWNSVHHLTEYASNTDFHVLIPGVFNNVQLGEYYLNNSEMIQMPEAWIGAINIEMLGELAAKSEKGNFTEHGYILESGDEWKPVLEVPQEYRIMSFPAVDQERIRPPIDYDTPAVPAAPVPE